MYDEMMNGKPSRDRLQQLINEAEKERFAHHVAVANKQASPIAPLQSLLVKVLSIFTS